MKHNNVLPNAHFKKDLQNRVKTWFNQPGRKKSRRVARQKKALAIAPRPVSGLLRPVVRCPTYKYNTKLRMGRGFTLEELKTAGISSKYAATIGLCVDHRRKRKPVHKRLETVILQNWLYPPNFKERSCQLLQANHLLKLMITDEEKEMDCFKTMRIERANRRLAGIRARR